MSSNQERDNSLEINENAGQHPGPISVEQPPGMRMELWAVEDLVPDPENPRKITDAAVDKLAASIASDGVWSDPILLADCSPYIIAGHRRRLAAMQLGITHVPVVILEGHMDPEQLRAVSITHNRLSEDVEWDRDLLSNHIMDLDAYGYGPRSLGFEEGDIVGLYDLDRGIREDMGLGGDHIDASGSGDSDADAEGATGSGAETVVAETNVLPGDVWVVGPLTLSVDMAANPQDLPNIFRVLRSAQRSLTTMPLLDGVKNMKDVIEDR